MIPRDVLHLVFTISYVVPGKKIPFTHTLQETNKLLSLLATTNCIFNVFIYAKLRENFWDHAKSMIMCRTVSTTSSSATSAKERDLPVL